MAASTSSSEQSKVCQDHMICLTIHFFTDITKKLLSAVLLMQKWVWLSRKSGCGPKICVIIQENNWGLWELFKKHCRVE